MKKSLAEITKNMTQYLYEGGEILMPPTKKNSTTKKDKLPSIPIKDLKPIATSKTKEPKISIQAVKQDFGEEINSFTDLKETITACHLCSLSRTRNNAVYGAGNPHSMLYIIGEAPGREEDIKAEPFVGRSGELLTKMLESIGISRKDVFITNIVKCRPPDNRDPAAEEIITCTPYLKKQIELGKPKIFLALGRYSAGFFLNDFKSSLGSLRGDFHSTEYGKVLVTFHPAAVLRSPNQRKPVVWEDLKMLSKFLYKQGFYNEEQMEVLYKNKVLEE